jgi:hypothetical protein
MKLSTSLPSIPNKVKQEQVLPRNATRKPIKTLIRETIGNESAQAFVRVFDSKFFGLKVFWFLGLFACSSFCFYLVARTLLTYLSYPVYTTTTIVHEMPTLFPKVTICNSAFAVTEFAYEMIKQINEEVYPSINLFNQTQMSNLTFDEMQSLVIVFAYFIATINLNTFSDASRQMLVHSLNEILWNCEFNRLPCSASDFSWSWDPFYGNCYSFNSGFNASGGRIGYKESLLPGSLFGLKLNIYVGYYDKLSVFNAGFFSNYGTNAPIYGLNVLIENNTYLSEDKANVIAINGGTVNYIAVQRKFNTKLPKPYSNCDIDTKNPGKIASEYYNLILSSPYQYSQELCVTQCMQKEVIRLCNCSMPYFLDLYNFTCHSVSDAFSSIYAYKNLQVESYILDCISRCPLECSSAQFTFTLTSQSYTGLLFEALVKSSQTFMSDFNYTPITPETASNKFVELNLYYDSLSFTSSEDSPSMDIVTLLGNVGGTLGLFLGICILSLFEIIHVLVETCFVVKSRLKVTHKI